MVIKLLHNAMASTGETVRFTVSRGEGDEPTGDGLAGGTPVIVSFDSDFGENRTCSFVRSWQ